MRVRILLPIAALVWLAIGVAAAVEFGHFGAGTSSCWTLGETAATVFVGPLNYIGVTPEADCPAAPEQ